MSAQGGSRRDPHAKVIALLLSPQRSAGIVLILLLCVRHTSSRSALQTACINTVAGGNVTTSAKSQAGGVSYPLSITHDSSGLPVFAGLHAIFSLADDGTTVSVLAGNAENSGSADGITGSDARFSSIGAIASSDRYGVVVADFSGIRVIAANNSVRTLLNTRGSSYRPSGVAVDVNSTIFFLTGPFYTGLLPRREYPRSRWHN